MNNARQMFQPGEVILIHLDGHPAFFARIETIRADHKKGWWQMKMLMLSIPLQTAVWILDEEQIRGASFTMQGHPVRIEAVCAPESAPAPAAEEAAPPSQQERDARVISMFDGDE